MSLFLRKFRRSRADAPAPTAPAAPVLDRSTLLAELEVHVPAPERLVRWDTATRACPDCTESVGRSEGRCRHCGHALV
jgi:tRNA(Ile2) C34 agmatinyltransferase TiaS